MKPSEEKICRSLFQEIIVTLWRNIEILIDKISHYGLYRNKSDLVILFAVLKIN